MNETSRSRLAEDLAVARTLAEEGRRAPLIGGQVYVIWGVAIASCLIANWAISTGAIAVSAWAIPLIWFSAMPIAGVWSGAVRSRIAHRPGATGFGNSVTAAVWSASGLFLGVFAAVLFATLLAAPEGALGKSRATGEIFPFAFSIFQPMCFGGYGVAMAASAEAAKSALLRNFSRVAFLAMAATTALIGRSEQLLVGAAAAIIVLALPGYLLMRRERSGA